MDTLSSSVSSLKVPPFPSSPTLTNRDFFPFKATPSRPQQPHHVFSTSTPTFLPKTKSFSHKSSPSLPFSLSPLKPRPSSSICNSNPATGYAAALVDVAQNTHSLHSVHRDVERLLKLLQSVKFQSPAVEEGNFHRHVVALLKMLLKRNRVGIVKEVLQEFERIYDELCGTQMVLVSSKSKMGKDELFGIAESVHQLSGAVRVKVRNLVQEGVPSFAD
ncbi:ATP synthase delta chain, chloroplastic [Vigna radiata var. radiata]|uniref:ATP synthase delta chain, chloroplastic n=1 Tax=Vigna radiata var. radiata TaxID=3916 RepID=A0A1S3TCK8_VIGRR|nr:ATP synthase delta chain, chloroplastic [Vigna radiata var. radiata]